MAKPLPIELRDRVVNAYNDGEGSANEIAKRFCICARSVFRWLALDRCASNLSPKDGPRGFPPKIPPDRFTELAELCAEKPDRSVAEIAMAWNARMGEAVSRSAMGRALLLAGLTFKKRRFKQ